MTGPNVHLGNGHYLSAGVPHHHQPQPLLINNYHSFIMNQWLGASEGLCPCSGVPVCSRNRRLI